MEILKSRFHNFRSLFKKKTLPKEGKPFKLTFSPISDQVSFRSKENCNIKSCNKKETNSRSNNKQINKTKTKWSFLKKFSMILEISEDIIII